MTDTGDAIVVHDVSKTYRLWRHPLDRLVVPLLHRCAAVLRGWSWLSARLDRACARRCQTHQALRGIDFRVRRGEGVGIIGVNGSGKSTLLQIIAGVLPPTTGTVEVRGRVAALLELGSSFNPELTGRENVRVAATLLGLSGAQITERLPLIAAFADIGEYLDRPVKTYSSGMAMRLAFAVQVHVDPDVLIVDEALAVGDAAFQAKAMARIDEILARGTTLLFVGHDLNAVKAFCHRALLLERGAVVMEGVPDDVITEYLRRVHEQSAPPGQRARPVAKGYRVGEAEVLSASTNGVEHAEVRFGAPLAFDLLIQPAADAIHPALIFDLLDSKGIQLTGRRIALPPPGPEGRPLRVHIGMHAHFQQGLYRVRLRLAEAPSLADTRILSRQEGLTSFRVIDDQREAFTGYVPVPMDVRIEP